MTDSHTAYVEGVRMLARRELSEAQVRQRLARRGHDPDAIDEAVHRLKEMRFIDDARLAGVLARTLTAVKHRGKLRVQHEIERAGIAAPTATHAVNEALSSLDDDALIEAALARRLRGRSTLVDDAEFRRLYRYLIRQGFEHDRVMKTLKARSK